MSENLGSGAPSFEEMARPAPQHALLEPFVGTFRARVRLWTGPGEPMETTGTMVNALDLGGRYLRHEYQGDAVEGPFPAFAGRGYMGFNKATGRFEGFWIDNASTMMQVETGEVDADGTTFTMRSELTLPGSGGRIVKRSVIRVLGRDRHTMTSWFAGPDGNETKSMEIEYERAS